MAALKGEKRFNTFLTVLFALISIFWVGRNEELCHWYDNG